MTNGDNNGPDKTLTKLIELANTKVEETMSEKSNRTNLLMFNDVVRYVTARGPWVSTIATCFIQY